MLYSYYPSAEYKISSVDKIIKDEEPNKKSPNTTKKKTDNVPITMKQVLARS
jgi:hypothetical protein